MILPTNHGLSVATKFEVYLKTQRNISGKTLRNYRADILHFTNWSKEFITTSGVKVNDMESLLPYITHNLIETYKQEALSFGVPGSTINRRLSTLRNFGKFLVETGETLANPTKAIGNAKPILTWEKQAKTILRDFERNLGREGVSPVTLKNYLSDIRQFLAWIPRAVNS